MRSDDAANDSTYKKTLVFRKHGHNLQSPRQFIVACVCFFCSSSANHTNQLNNQNRKPFAISLQWISLTKKPWHSLSVRLLLSTTWTELRSIDLFHIAESTIFLSGIQSRALFGLFIELASEKSYRSYIHVAFQWMNCYPVSMQLEDVVRYIDSNLIQHTEKVLENSPGWNKLWRTPLNVTHFPNELDSILLIMLQHFSGVICFTLLYILNWDRKWISSGMQDGYSKYGHWKLVDLLAIKSIQDNSIVIHNFQLTFMRSLTKWVKILGVWKSFILIHCGQCAW